MKVETEKCIGCMKCVNECPNRVFEAENGKAKVANPKDCTRCLGCVQRCPNRAITSADGKLDNFQPYKF
ncbi:MAG: 4Fe-4S dicluster domain-containing protein [Sphingobacteriia bacterium]|nr:4Fe-4S dicluster domain-containing protein [Sphingobacteriia bacterium]